MNEQVPRQATAAVALNYVVWGVLPLFWMLLSHVDSVYILAQRIVWSALISGAWVLAASRGMGPLRSAFSGASPALVFSAMAIGVNWGLYIWAVGNGFVSYAALAYFVSPLMSVFLGAVVFGERLTAGKWAAILLTAAGALLFGWGRSGTGLFIVFGVAGSFAIYSAIKKTVAVQTVPGLFIESAILTPVALALMGTGILSPGTALDAATWALFVVAGLVTFLPLVVMSHYARLLPLSLLGILQFIVPVTQLGLSVTVFGESITGAQAGALAVILAGVGLFLAQTWRPPRNRPARV